ncbi:Uncharacterised protein [Weissella viridescens]|uniref:Uncharacterized protein n=1 Tax=Weissella viridescens TaxID=1629 RepID=A0A380P8B7_WEIVI|nr:Uncharacterised protein [Weissella viridescens]
MTFSSTDKVTKLGLTFDDVLLVPAESHVYQMMWIFQLN